MCGQCDPQLRDNEQKNEVGLKVNNIKGLMNIHLSSIKYHIITFSFGTKINTFVGNISPSVD